MKTKKGKIALRALIASLAIAVLVVIVWAAVPDYPTVDGMLESEEEYDYPGGDGLCQLGSYSSCYGRYIGDQGSENNGFYICNDWWKPEENYDPDEDCNAVNMFWWTEYESPYNQYWRVVLHPDETCTLWEKYNDGQDNWEIVDTNGWDVYTGYNESCNSDTAHPIWELRIPPEHCTGDVVVGAIDPKAADQEDCPPTDPNTVLGQNNGDPINSKYGRPPDWDSADFPNWGENNCE